MIREGQRRKEPNKTNQLPKAMHTYEKRLGRYSHRFPASHSKWTGKKRNSKSDAIKRRKKSRRRKKEKVRKGPIWY